MSTIANPPPPAIRFQTNTLHIANFCTDIISKASEHNLTQIDPIVIKVGIVFLQNNYTPENLIVNWITYSYPFWEQIRNCKEEFFDENVKTVFANYDAEMIRMFRELFYTTRPDGSSLISKDQKNKIWTSFQSLVKISLHYIHESRHPTRGSDGRIIYKDPNHFTHVADLEKLIDLWKIRENLRFF